jgi:hypothetical protein
MTIKKCNITRIRHCEVVSERWLVSGAEPSRTERSDVAIHKKPPIWIATGYRPTDDKSCVRRPSLRAVSERSRTACAAIHVRDSGLPRLFVPTNDKSCTRHCGLDPQSPRKIGQLIKEIAGQAVRLRSMQANPRERYCISC